MDVLKTQAAYEAIRQYFSRPGAELAQADERDPESGAKICYYRKPGNGSCAVGCLIPDELYDPEMEGTSVYPLLIDTSSRLPSGKRKFNRELAKLFDGVAVNFLCSAQNAHDGAVDVPNFIDRLDEAARAHGLKVMGE